MVSPEAGAAAGVAAIAGAAGEGGVVAAGAALVSGAAAVTAGAFVAGVAGAAISAAGALVVAAAVASLVAIAVATVVWSVVVTEAFVMADSVWVWTIGLVCDAIPLVGHPAAFVSPLGCAMACWNASVPVSTSMNSFCFIYVLSVFVCNFNPTPVWINGPIIGF